MSAQWVEGAPGDESFTTNAHRPNAQVTLDKGDEKCVRMSRGSVIDPLSFVWDAWQ